MNRAAVAVAMIIGALLAGCSSGGHAAPGSTATAACPSVGQMVDSYLTHLKAGDKDPSLDMTGCDLEQQAQRLADIQLIIDNGGVK